MEIIRKNEIQMEILQLKNKTKKSLGRFKKVQIWQKRTSELEDSNRNDLREKRLKTQKAPQ